MTPSDLPTALSLHTPAYGAVDLTTCDREPIHVPGAIQPHGVLIAFDATSLVAVMVSANSAEMIGLAPDRVIGAGVDDIFDDFIAGQLRQRIKEWAPHEPLVLVLPPAGGGALAGQEVDVVMHLSGDRVVVEIESYGRPREVMLSYQSARSAMGRLAGQQTAEDLAAQLAVEVRDLTGFDRVMVYRFDEQWNGEVVAEERRSDLTPYLGLHYPATDIPVQARRLYTVNWTRLIADVAYAPVPLLPVRDPDTLAPLDLTHSTLRSVSPIHLEYLTNMGVTASMSISIVIDDKLWGLVACHHYSGAHRPSHDARAAAEFLGQVASQHIAERERSDAREAALHGQARLARLTARLASATSDTLMDQLVNDPELLSLVGASGAALCFDGRIRTVGRVPAEASLRHLAAVMLGEPDGSPVECDHLASLDPAFAEFSDIAAGALAMGSARDRWLVWLRPEWVQVVTWGGDPGEKADQDPSVRLSPRKSFESWREVVRGRSSPWEPWHLISASGLRTHTNALQLAHSRDQIEVAESLQHSVLPAAVPSFPHLDLVVRYRPASAYQLGGDWWDAIQLDDDRVVFVVGDVAGHGVSAVAAMTQIKTALRAYLFAEVPPPTALDLLDMLMVEMLDEQVATVIVAVLHIADRRLEVSSAGHPPPVLMDASGLLDLEVQQRPLLGLGEGSASSAVVTLPPGSTLLLYTDGLVERRGIDLAESLQALRVASGTGPVGDHLSAWVDELVARAGDASDDDTTLLAVYVP